MVVVKDAIRPDRMPAPVSRTLSIGRLATVTPAELRAEHLQHQVRQDPELQLLALPLIQALLGPELAARTLVEPEPVELELAEPELVEPVERELLEQELVERAPERAPRPAPGRASNRRLST